MLELCSQRHANWSVVPKQVGRVVGRPARAARPALPARPDRGSAKVNASKTHREQVLQCGARRPTAQQRSRDVGGAAFLIRMVALRLVWQSVPKVGDVTVVSWARRCWRDVTPPALLGRARESAAFAAVVSGLQGAGQGERGQAAGDLDHVAAKWAGNAHFVVYNFSV